MKEYANNHIKDFHKDEDLEEDFLKDIPVPSNILHVPKLDDFLVKAEGPRMFIKTKATTLKRITRKVRHIFAPTSSIWTMLDRFRNGNWTLVSSNGNKAVEIDIED